MCRQSIEFPRIACGISPARRRGIVSMDTCEEDFMTRAKLGAIAAVFLVGIIANVHAQEAWPARSVRIIVPSSPGGGTDVFARLLAQALTASTKQSFVVENKPGASGNIGAQAAAAAMPDGYTFLVASNSSIAINPFLLSSPNLDVQRDLVPVARGVMSVNILLVNPSVPAKSVAEFVAFAKKHPSELTFGSAGTGSSPYLGVRMMEEIAGVKFVHVPYKGLGPAYQDLLAGRLQFIYADLASAMPYVKGGKLEVLAIDRKTTLLPNVPTFAEAGWPQFDSPISFSVMAPARVPSAILQRMASEVNKALTNIAPRLEQQALVPVFDTPAEFDASLKKERADWGAFIQRNGITGDQ
jgi:tripartite-type tricarboxylate transporter receptor subunit TctC